MEKKRLGRDDRINLQAGIAKGRPLARIAKGLGKSRSTVYREIVNNCVYKDCRHTCAHCKRRCGPSERDSRFALGQCRDFAAGECERWGKFPLRLQRLPGIPIPLRSEEVLRLRRGRGFL